METIRGLEVGLGLNWRELDKGLKQSQKALGNFKRSADRTASAISSSFKKLKKTIFSLKGAISGLIASLVAHKITQAIKGVALLAARYETLGVVMNQVGATAGYSKKEMRKFDEALRDAGISATRSRENLAKLIAANIDLEKSTQLARIAQDAAVIGNINSSEAFQRMVHGITAAQTIVLRNIGINVSFMNSYRKMAKQLGKNTQELTEHEKLQARVNAVMEEGKSISGVYTAAMETAGKKLGSLPRHVENLRLAIGTPMLEGFSIIVDDITAAVKRLTDSFGTRGFQKAIHEATMNVADLTKNFLEWATAIDSADITSVANQFMSFAEGVGNAAIKMKDLASYATQIPASVWKTIGLIVAGGKIGGVKGAAAAAAFSLPGIMEDAIKNTASYAGFQVPSGETEGVIESSRKISESIMNIFHVIRGEMDATTGEWIKQHKDMKKESDKTYSVVQQVSHRYMMAKEEEVSQLARLQQTLIATRKEYDRLSEQPIDSRESLKNLIALEKKMEELQGQISALRGTTIDIEAVFNSRGLNDLMEKIDDVYKQTSVGMEEGLRSQAEEFAEARKTLLRTRDELMQQKIKAQVETPELDASIEKINDSLRKLPASMEEINKEINSIITSRIDPNVQGLTDFLYNTTIQAVNREIKYGWGGKGDLSTVKEIDCSGFVEQVNQAYIKSLGDAAEKAGLDKGMINALKGRSDQIIEKVKEQTGKMWEGLVKDIPKEAIQSGMLIGLDASKGDKYDKGRYKEIDHVAQLLVDAAGKLKVIQSAKSTGGVSVTDFDEYFKNMKNIEAYIVDPYEKLDDSARKSLAQFQEYNEQRLDMHKQLTLDITELTLGSFEAEKMAIRQQAEEWRDSTAIYKATAEQRKKILSQIAEWEKKNIADIEQRFIESEQKKAEEARKTALENASTFAEYARLVQSGPDDQMLEAQRAIWKQFMEDYKDINMEMVNVRLGAYDQIIAEAEKNANTEMAMIAQVNKEYEMKNALQNMQQYGTPEQAGEATWALNFGTFKSDMTKARELAVKEADAFKTLFDDLGDSIGDSFSGMISGLIDGTMNWKEALASALDQVANAFMEFAMSVFKAWVQNQLGSIFSEIFSSGSGGGGGISGIFGTASSGASAAGSAASTISDWNVSWGAAKGGVAMRGVGGQSGIVTKPSLFAFAKGGAGNFGLMGEKGPEAIMPLSRMKDGKLGVQMQKDDVAQPEVKVQEGDIRVVNLLDPGLFGQYAQTKEGEKTIVNIMQRNKGVLS